MARSLLCLAVFAAFTLPALADLPPPPPARGFKRVPYENVLKLDKEIPGYKFYSFQRLGIGGKETLGEELKLGTKAGIPAPSSSSPSVRTGIVAVPVKVMDELKTKENLAKLLSRDFEGKLPAGVVVHETHGTIRDIKSSDVRSKVENVITVSADEKAGVKFSEKETAPKTSSSSAFSILIACGALAMSIGSVCFLLARRRRRLPGSSFAPAWAAR